jgi:hypothetical protein
MVIPPAPKGELHAARKIQPKVESQKLKAKLIGKGNCQLSIANCLLILDRLCSTITACCATVPYFSRDHSLVRSVRYSKDLRSAYKV